VKQLQLIYLNFLNSADKDKFHKLHQNQFDNHRYKDMYP